MKRKDVLTKKQRSYCMSQIRSKDTKVECLIRSELFKRGYRFRKHVKSLPGKPDIVFVTKKIAVFVDGDFWHGRNPSSLIPKLSPFWQKKIQDNINRDKRNFSKLRRQGWKVVRVWETDAYKNLSKQMSKIEAVLESNED